MTSFEVLRQEFILKHNRKMRTAVGLAIITACVGCVADQGPRVNYTAVAFAGTYRLASCAGYANSPEQPPCPLHITASAPSYVDSSYLTFGVDRSVTWVYWKNQHFVSCINGCATVDSVQTQHTVAGTYHFDASGRFQLQMDLPILGVPPSRRMEIVPELPRDLAASSWAGPDSVYLQYSDQAHSGWFRKQ